MTNNDPASDNGILRAPTAYSVGRQVVDSSGSIVSCEIRHLGFDIYEMSLEFTP